MKNFCQLILIVFTLSSTLFALPSQGADSVLEEIQETGVIKVAVRSDAVPFGYLDLNNELRGLCLDFFALLREKISQEINRNILSIRLYKSTLFNRFKLVEDNIVYLECGPNTIHNLGNDKLAFSQPFFITGTQLLIRQEDASKFNFNSSLANLIIGVLRNTTTAEFIENKYPLAELELFQGVTGRRRGVQALQQGKIDAFASDGILLRGESEIQQLSRDRYPLVPQQPLTCDYYGIILPGNDSKWQELVNSVIEDPQARKLLDDWFESVFPDIKDTVDFCKTNNPKSQI